MLFNSFAFLFFFPVVCILYWLLPNKVRNGMLLVASYYFYMNWKPVYALLILFSTMTTWLCALKIDNENPRRKMWLTLCLVVNFGILFVYKYLNFATESVFHALELCGLRMEVPGFHLLLPVGISFYTFQAVGYTIDVYRRTVRAEKSFFTYALFVAFFPQLVAGPIERAKNLLVQFHKKHEFCGDDVIEGLKMMLWGYFMKLCIAENVAPYVDAVFNNLPNHNGTSVLLATFFFSFQIFCDFGGYSLIAIGAARCMGFTLMQNFNHPYLATSVKDFWRRWHISLSSWFAEYVYIPLGGSRCYEPRHLGNLFVTMLLSGVWHGANWTFIVWGAYHGLLQVLYNIKVKFSRIPALPTLLSVAGCFVLSMFGWIFFRANTLGDAFLAIHKIFCQHGMLYNGEGKPTIAMCFVMMAILLFKEIKDEYHWNIRFVHHRNFYVSSAWTAFLLVLILLCAKFNGGQFIYFQF